MRASGWWDERIVGGFATYWLYQHMGNLAPAQLAEDEVYAMVRSAEDDAGPALREFAFRADREVAGTRWSFCRDFGRARLLMIDSRAGRVLDPPEERSMLDPHEWAWMEEHAAGAFDHLLIGTSLPFLLAPGLHYLEAWNEAVCNGAWGHPAALLGEKLRQAIDLEHWAAFGTSLEHVGRIVRDVGTGALGPAPASIVGLSGDVHHAYLAEVGFPRGTGMRSAVYQATCSPFRNPLTPNQQRVIRFWFSWTGQVLGGLLARGSGVPRPPTRFRLAHESPMFENQLGTLELEGRRGRLRLERAISHRRDPAAERLLPLFDHPLDRG